MEAFLLVQCIFHKKKFLTACLSRALEEILLRSGTVRASRLSIQCLTYIITALLEQFDGCPSNISTDGLKALSKSTFYYLWAVMQHSVTSLVPKSATIEDFDDYVRISQEVITNDILTFLPSSYTKWGAFRCLWFKLTTVTFG